MHRLTATAILFALACSRGTEPGPGSTVRQPALLEYVSQPAIINVPASAPAGTPVRVEFTTYGGGCIGQTVNQTVHVGLTAEIRSFQDEYLPRENEVCTAELRVESNVVTVTFAVPGTALVRVLGRRLPGNTSVVLERVVTISPQP